MDSFLPPINAIHFYLLKPLDETQLEQTIGYEQLAVDLTAELAKREKDFYVKKALDFALLEDFDHLYRYSDLLHMNQGVIIIEPKIVSLSAVFELIHLLTLSFGNL